MTRTVARDVVFAERVGFRPLTLDVHAGDETDAPVVLFVHGGGWRLGSRRSFGPNFTTGQSFDRIVAAGFTVVSVDYRLSGEARFPAQIDDVRAALDWVKTSGDEYGFDGNRVVMWGESAGATIAALVALEPDSGVLGVVDWYGPSNLVSMAEGVDPQTVAASRESEWLGVSALDEPEVARSASPVFAVHPAAPPFLIAHGDADAFVPHSQSEELRDALSEVGVRVEFTTVAGANHLWNGVADPAPLLAQAIAFAREVTPKGPVHD